MNNMKVEWPEVELRPDRKSRHGHGLRSSMAHWLDWVGLGPKFSCLKWVGLGWVQFLEFIKFFSITIIQLRKSVTVVYPYRIQYGVNSSSN